MDLCDRRERRGDGGDGGEVRDMRGGESAPRMCGECARFICVVA